MKITGAQLRLRAWILSLGVSLVAIIVWLQSLNWQLDGLSTYKIFPVLGILAFSLMWAMSVVRFVRIRLGIKASELKNYYRSISYAVILLVVLHPGLLVWQLMRDGFGLPPGSYLDHYVAASLKWAATLGTIAFFVFVAYELRYKFKNRPWWKYIEYVQGLGLAAIFYHSLQLGGQLQRGWFRFVWYFYGVSLLIILLDLYTSKIRKKA